ncbi:MAG: 50S ribosomal protein L25 [Candidatus Promineifilaceae bacterium]|nr:50S ribosomal protein L25 [Candidatus Promineifilaceae bacterium]
MAERVSFDAQSRSMDGKKARQLRREGVVPAVIYGQSEVRHIQIPAIPLRRALRQAGSNELINVQLGGDTITVLAREIQQHPTRGDLIHVDFYEVNMRETITADVALITVGTPDSELQTLGQVTQILHSVPVECLPGDLVSEIEVDISGVASPDEIIYLSDITPPKGVTFMMEPETAITSFDYYREEEEEEEEEDLLFAPGADEVEVIGRGDEEEEEEEFEEEE